MKKYEVTMVTYYQYENYMSGQNYNATTVTVEAETREAAEKAAKKPGYKVVWIEDVELREAINAKLKAEQKKRDEKRRKRELKKKIAELEEELKQLEAH